MEVTEAATFSKTGDESENEDAFLVTDELVAVFDGVTEADPQGDGPTPGRSAVQALVEATRSLDLSMPAGEIIAYLHETVAGVADGSEGIGAMGAILDVKSKRIMRVGDIRIGIDGMFDNPFTIWEDDAAMARSTLLRCCLANGQSVDELRANDPGRQMILPLIRASVHLRNREQPYGFAVLDGSFTPKTMTSVSRVREGMEVVLATDGYFNPRSSLVESERALRSAVAADPLRLGPPGGLAGVGPGHISFGDRTYVRVLL